MANHLRASQTARAKSTIHLCGIYSQFQLGNIRSRDVFRPIARERKYLMDYKSQYGKRTREFIFLGWGRLIKSSFLYFGGGFSKTIIPLTLVAYQMGSCQEPITRSLHLPYILESTFARIFLFLEQFSHQVSLNSQESILCSAL